MVTRPAHQMDEMAEALEELGASVLRQPAIEIGPPPDWGPVDEAVQTLGSFAWVVFSSANGVRAFLDNLLAKGRDMRALADVGLAAIGPATAETLTNYGLRADLQPGEYRAEALAEALAPKAVGKRVLLVRASRGRETLAEGLAAAGVDVMQVMGYESRDVTTADESIRKALAAGRVDWTTVTSSAIARSLVALFGEDLRRTKLAAISPLTAGVLADAGYSAAAVATEYNSAGLRAAIVAANKRS